MRIPPFYNDSTWQRFFAGIVVGMIIGWLFFLYNFGNVHEKLVLEINKQKSTIENQEETIDILQRDQEEINEEAKKNLTVQDIKITVVNEEDIKLSELTLHELKANVEHELEIVRNKNIETVANTKELLLKAVENKTFVVNENRYKLNIEQLFLFTTLEIFVRIEEDS
ncbi:sporulation membrane protein YtrI [Texcoconibacillus texcoconensis]|uniref:Na+/melibiose symporter-like transporter n=1 Tax=Texcoconibacillus texcoconensis TaxID=1095777 RepID=A0A840QMW6_9BACI|nr:sporulation membrane protein YtrI [Texcoconibacillus texcoconensis]MBB5172732.1 Na+/melibiose symporter-like transporter [Texcoconibacillus texcoconensis]